MKHAKYHDNCKSCKHKLDDTADKFRGYCWSCWQKLPWGPKIIVKAP